MAVGWLITSSTAVNKPVMSIRQSYATQPLSDRRVQYLQVRGSNCPVYPFNFNQLKNRHTFGLARLGCTHN